MPDNFFAEVEQAAFDPSNFVPGIGPSPDPMLQARLFAYGDAQRYRLGINHPYLPVNAAQGVQGGARNYGRDGAMRFDANGGRGPNYEPNSLQGPAQTGAPYDLGYEVSGPVGPGGVTRHAEDDDFSQAGALYRVMSPEAKAQLIANLSGSLSQVSREDVLERSLGYFRQADAELGRRLEDAVTTLRGARAA